MRLDQDKIEHLDMAKKEYTETTFEQMRAQMQKAMAGAIRPARRAAAAGAHIDR